MIGWRIYNMGMTDKGIEFVCDVCDLAVLKDSRELPWKWTVGKFVAQDGYDWSPKVYVCESCWASPNVDSPRSVFKKLWEKFKK